MSDVDHIEREPGRVVARSPLDEREVDKPHPTPVTNVRRERRVDAAWGRPGRVRVGVQCALAVAVFAEPPLGDVAAAVGLASVVGTVEPATGAQVADIGGPPGERRTVLDVGADARVHTGLGIRVAVGV